MLHALPSERCLLSAPSCPDTAGPQTLPRPQQPKRGARRRAQAVPGSRAGIAHEHPGAAAPGLQARTVSGCRAAGGLRRICVPSTHEISQDPPERARSLLPKAGRSLSCSARNVLSDPSSLLPSVEQRAGYSSLCTEVLGGLLALPLSLSRGSQAPCPQLGACWRGRAPALVRLIPPLARGGDK